MKPLVLIAETTDTRTVEHLKTLRWGRMFCMRSITPYRFERWGFDNGAFMDWTKHRPFDEFGYRSRLDRALSVSSDPYMAICPDIVAGGLHSLDFSMKWISRLPTWWWWYLAVQDGMAIADIEPIIHMFSGVFLGGTDKFKYQAYRWSEFAHKHGKKFHYGRAGTLRKLRHAIRVNADSLDSSFPLWTRSRFGTFVDEWNENLESQGAMEYVQA